MIFFIIIFPDYLFPISWKSDWELLTGGFVAELAVLEMNGNGEACDLWGIEREPSGEAFSN